MESDEFPPGKSLRLTAYLPRKAGRARALMGFENPATSAYALVVLVEGSE